MLHSEVVRALASHRERWWSDPSRRCPSYAILRNRYLTRIGARE